jgi:hypothetical protein
MIAVIVFMIVLVAAILLNCAWILKYRNDIQRLKYPEFVALDDI